MQLRLDAFRQFIERHIKVRWEREDEQWQLRPGGGELYLQEKVLKKASAFITPEMLGTDAKENLIKALLSHVNLLSQFEGLFAKVFIQRTEQTVLSEKISTLLHEGERPYEKRVSDFLEWAKIRKLPGGKKSGINGTVCSYFLAMANPREYAYCKPMAYNKAVDALLGKEERRDDPVERIVHCRQIYKELLRLLETEYNLKEGNLLDVHSLCYIFSAVDDKAKDTADPSPGVNYWTYAPGEDASHWREFYENGIMAIGWDYLGDLSQYDTKEELLSAIAEENGMDRKPFNAALACHQFSRTIEKGDIVFAKKGLNEIVGYGVVTSGYRFDGGREKFKHTRDVKWLAEGSWILESEQMALKTLTNISAYTDFVNSLIKLTGYPQAAENGSPSEIPDYSPDLKQIFMDDQAFWQIVELLKNKKNIILQGPPGVGKTFIARHLAWAIMEQRDNNRIGMVQFHQSYAYEDFIQGFRPHENGGFRLKNGVFYQFCKKAENNPENEYFFIIDEINRGNLSKIFGELMVLIEPDKRGTYALPLTYASSQQEVFSVPDNLYLIGTMNTADRSLALVDYALRRRFCFVDLEPAFATTKFMGYMEEMGVPAEMAERINRRMNQLNDIIAGSTKNLGPGFCIGHSYFCANGKEQPKDEQWYRSIIDFEIAPLLREYWFDAPEEAQKHIDSLRS